MATPPCVGVLPYSSVTPLEVVAVIVYTAVEFVARIAAR
jgi:hypothetical protein